MKYAHQDVLRDGLNIVKNNATFLCICSQLPGTRAEAYTTYALAKTAVTGTDFTWATVANVGERLTMGAKAGLTIDTSGIMAYAAIVDGTRLLIVTTSNPVELTAGNLFDCPAIHMTAPIPV